MESGTPKERDESFVGADTVLCIGLFSVQSLSDKIRSRPELLLRRINSRSRGCFLAFQEICHVPAKRPHDIQSLGVLLHLFRRFAVDYYCVLAGRVAVFGKEIVEFFADIFNNQFCFSMSQLSELRK